MTEQNLSVEQIETNKIVENTEPNWLEKCSQNRHSQRIFDFGKEVCPYIGFVMGLLIVHYFVVVMYCNYCVVTYYNLYNVVFSVSPMCSYLLDIINICNGSLTKMWYIVGGFIVIKLSTTFGKLNLFANYSRRPEIRDEKSVH